MVTVIHVKCVEQIIWLPAEARVALILSVMCIAGSGYSPADEEMLLRSSLGSFGCAERKYVLHDSKSRRVSDDGRFCLTGMAGY